MLFPFGPFGKTVCFRGQGPGNKEAKYVKLWVTDNNMMVATVVYVALPYLEILIREKKHLRATICWLTQGYIRISLLRLIISQKCLLQIEPEF